MYLQLTNTTKPLVTLKTWIWLFTSMSPRISLQVAGMTKPPVTHMAFLQYESACVYLGCENRQVPCHIVCTYVTFLLMCLHMSLQLASTGKALVTVNTRIWLFSRVLICIFSLPVTTNLLSHRVHEYGLSPAD